MFKAWLKFLGAKKGPDASEPLPYEVLEAIRHDKPRPKGVPKKLWKRALRGEGVAR